MQIIADTHCHFYSSYDLPRFLEAAFRNLKQLSSFGTKHEGEAAKVLCLTERSDCHFFRELQAGQIDPSPFNLELLPDKDALCISSTSGEKLYLTAGRQFASKERLELLALTKDLDLPDGLPIHELISKVSAQGAVPILTWAVGKWLFRRANIVRDLLENPAATLLLGDSSLRPSLFPVPSAFELGRKNGVRIVCGTDPLPIKGEEDLPGSYATAIDAPFNFQSPAQSIRNALMSKSTHFEACGKRSSLLSALSRIKRLRFG